MRKSLTLALTAGITVLVSACWGGDTRPAKPDAQILDWDKDIIKAGSFVNQGWSKEDLNSWYSASQGSRFMPKKWLMALEIVDGEDMFMSRENINAMQYVYTGGEMPMGFVTDQWKEVDQFGTYSRPTKYTGEEWMGLNCAACHTNRIITPAGETLFVHGAPTMAGFMSFINGVLYSVEATLADDAKYARFAARLLGENYSAQDAIGLKAELQSFYDWRKLVHDKNGGVQESDYGYGRLDAVGHILNQVSLLVNDMDENSVNGAEPIFDLLPESTQWPSDAPVSYPHIWNAGQQALVQWNGVAANSEKKIAGLDIGALGRNTGEVTGVFADVRIMKNEVKDNTLHVKLESSAKTAGLIELEKVLSRLPSPVWPKDRAGFEINATKWSQGKTLYGQYCLECHSVLKPEDTGTWLPVLPSRDNDGNRINQDKQKIVMNWISDVGTDIWMACNADQYGIKRRKSTGDRITPEQPYYGGASMLTDVVKSTIKSQIKEIALKTIGDLFKRGGSQRSEPEAPFVTMEMIVVGGGEGPDHRKRAKAESCWTSSQEARGLKLENGIWVNDENKPDAFLAVYEAEKALKLADTLSEKEEAKKVLEAAKTNLISHEQLRYKSRPLNGIWATAPYLHNGSVPTLYDLLLPPRSNDSVRVYSSVLRFPPIARDAGQRRPDCFYTGSEVYDPVKVGYVSPSCDAEPTNASKLYKMDTNAAGNANAGHNYPSDRVLTDEERWALVEYLKYPQDSLE